MVASNQTELASNTFPAPGLDDLKLLRTAVIYGANASGKSNLIAAIGTMKTLVVRSFELPESRAPEWSWFDRVSPFRLDLNSQNEPTTWEIEFLYDSVRYHYGFAVAGKRVIKEFLIAYPNKVPQHWFDRSLGSDTEDSWNWSEHLKGEKKKIAVLTRKDALFLSVAAQFNHQQLKPLYDWFANNLRTIYDPQSDEFEVTVRLANEQEAFHNLIKAALKAADLGIDGFEIQMPPEQPDTVQMADGRVVRIPRRRMPPIIKTSHSIDGSSEKVSFDLRREESLGTRRFFGLIGHWVRAFQHSEVIFNDELDASMHPMLTRFMVSMFNTPELNTGNAQAIFTTHDSTLLDNSIFRRDQIWFTEKEKNGASHLYPLLQYRPRKDESLQRGYLAGRYGAIPFIGGTSSLVEETSS
jgi:AAA15 family ATPase/GTPase